VAVVLLALASTWVQLAWHLPMALAQAGSPAIPGVICGGSIDAAGIAQLVSQGLLPADSNDSHTGNLCDLLTVPAADTAFAVRVPAVPANAIVPASLAAEHILASPQSRLPPARAPPVA